ncbi:putative enoyl reductase-like protein [Hapsidospora chrysogenum ATCC 11550]|uniref:very-long-chain enoyl-CoA reductase n=1 Tax=Hapsidospora chrysogenum (strain ATCC 11550 / CBS 779.69 / DSM 880 / IAM 14645 / JCM 23072 / IMI 49137) TaxID=857340 RepID=A0A086TBM1_HAPC1|nr:putative enoyl reductase-like protein [Hapsidospora chrysogenum ATCC 11550]
MATLKTLKLTNRSPKQPIRNLPPSVDVSADTTVEDVKILIAKAVRMSDHNRIGLFDPSTKKTLKNRQARIADEQAVASTGEVLVKDLGPQIGWKTVFIIEYLGPILIHAAVVAARPYLYAGAPSYRDLSPTQWLGFAMFQLHFLKREYETLFVHKFSASTMPFRNVFKNSFFYWALSGLLCAYFIYSPTSLAARADQPAIDAVGALIFLFGEVNNALVHRYLSSLRPAGSTERRIPVGYGFGLVTCPNYMFEVLSWVGVIVALRDWTSALFICVGIAQMSDWAKGKERAYRKEFGDRYKKKRYTMLPGLF